MTYKQIMGLIPTVQSMALVGENIRVAKKKKVDAMDLVKLGTKNIVGVGLIKAESDLISL